MDLAYRSLEHVAVERFDALCERRQLVIAELAPLRAVYVRRVARAAAGLVATLLGIATFAWAYGAAAVAFFGSPSGGDPRGALTQMLLFAWPAAIVTYFGMRPIAGAYLDERLARPIARTGDAVLDLAKLEATEPTIVLRERVAACERWSVALPLMGLAFLTPLTLHFVVALVFRWTTLAASFSGSGFDGWILASVVLVGHAHIVLALCGWRFATRARGLDRDEVEAQRRRAWLRAWGFTALASIFPGAFLVAIPPLLVLVTGLAFIPAAYLAMSSRIVRERTVVEVALASPRAFTA